MARKTRISVALKNIDVIKKLHSSGATVGQIAEHLGICPASLYKYINDNEELREVFEEARVELVDGLISELFRRAQPRVLTTIKTYEKNGETTTETTVREVDGDYGALTFLLKNYAPEHFSNEPRVLKLKEEELALKKKIAEQNDWTSLDEVSN